MLRTLLNDEAGFIVSAELVLVATILVIGMIVGLSEIQHAVVAELGDVAEAIGALDQSYNYRGIRADLEGAGEHASCSGSGFNDEEDDCDCKGITLTSVCGKDDPSASNNAEATN